MKKSLFIILSLLLSLSLFTGCSGASENVTEEPVEEVTEPATIYYEKNDLVNKFITDLIEKSGCSVDDIRQGQYSSQGVCHFEGCYTKITDESGSGEGEPTLTVTIEGSDEEDISETMFAAATKVWKTVDPSLSEDTINEAIATLTEAGDDLEGIEVGENIKLDYSPYSDNKDSAFTQHWVKISIYNYNLE